MKNALRRAILRKSVRPATDADGPAAPLRNRSKKRTFQSEQPVPVQSGNRSQDPAISKIAHDLRNPIYGILAASQYLVDDIGSKLDKHQLTVLQSIEISGVRLLELVEAFVQTSPNRLSSKQPLGGSAALQGFAEQVPTNRSGRGKNSRKA